MNVMKKINFLLIGLFALGFASCSIEKRTFRPGYHIEWKTAVKNDGKESKKSEEINSTSSVESLTQHEATLTQPDVSLKSETVESTSTGDMDANPTDLKEENSYSISTHKEKKRARLEEKLNSNEYRSMPSETSAKANLSPMPFEKKNENVHSSDQIVEIILAIFLPPLGVYLHEGTITTNFWISLVLTILFWIPGSIFSVLVVLDLI